jgi:hypothetical protein
VAEQRSGRTGKPAPGAGGNRARNAALGGVLFLTLGLAGAFLVSAIAGVGGGEDTAVDPTHSETADGRTLPAVMHVRAEVLNGAGRPGLARLATNRLRGEGFDVVFFGNAARFDHAHSVVLDRTGDIAAARAVAAALGIDSVATALDAALLLDVSVVLGADWPPPAPPGAPLHNRLRSLIAPADTAP